MSVHMDSFVQVEETGQLKGGNRILYGGFRMLDTKPNVRYDEEIMKQL